MGFLRSLVSGFRVAHVTLLLTSRSVLATPPICSSPSLSCHNTTVQDTCCINYPGGQILQTQFWDTKPATGPADHWTIHGLWPDYCDGTYPQYCDAARQYTNITQILLSYGRSSLLQYMETYWKDQGGNDESFWEHEWGKHGTCYSTLEPSCYTNYTPQEEVLDYFQRTVDLFMQLDTYQFLADAGIYPSASKNYTYAEVAAAVSKPRGVTALVQCYHGQLDEVWYFYDVAGTIATGDFIPINPVGSTSSCPTTLQYLPKNLTSIAKSNDTAPPTPFVGSGYLLVESGGVEAGCINSAGKWSNSSPKSCATFQGASSGSGISLSSSKGACAIKNAKFKCGSNIAKSQLFTDISGNLAYTNRTSFYSSKAPNGTTQGGVYTKKHNVTLGITWEALSVEGFTL